MSTLLFQLRGPMQSWGTRSRYDLRDTWPYPTKSGVIGLLAAALGRDRQEDISDLTALKLGVRVDRRGTLLVDYQTARCVLAADGRGYRDVQSWRYFLSDAAFLVGVEGRETLLEAIHQALLEPRFPLYLGRKGYVPSPPPYLPDGKQPEGLEQALRSYPYLLDQEPRADLLLVLETSSAEGRLVYDQPVAPFARRKFGPRYVREVVLRKEEVPHVDQQTHP